MNVWQLHQTNRRAAAAKPLHVQDPSTLMRGNKLSVVAWCKQQCLLMGLCVKKWHVHRLQAVCIKCCISGTKAANGVILSSAACVLSNIQHHP
jgi:hypothetical protein